MKKDIKTPPQIKMVKAPEIILCGGVSKSAPATQVIKDYLAKHLHLLKKDYLEKTKSEIKNIEAISFRKQTIDGYNTWIKAKVNNSEMVEFLIYEHHSGEIRDVNFRKVNN